MTAEHVTLLDLGDLRALRVACTRCRCSLTLHLDETVRIPQTCPACQEDWMDPPAMASVADLLARALKGARQADRQQARFTLQLELLTPPDRKVGGV